MLRDDLEAVAAEMPRQWWEREPRADHVSAAMERWHIEASRYRAGLPHALTEDEALIVDGQDEASRALADALVHGWPGIPEGDYRRIVAAWCEEFGIGLGVE